MLVKAYCQMKIASCPSFPLMSWRRSRRLPFLGGEAGNMACAAEMGYFSSEGSTTPDLDKINANFFGNN